MKLHKYYSIDECNNEQSLFETLESLQEEGKIDFEKVDRWTIKVIDIDLTNNEGKNLVDLFEKLDLYHTLIEDEDEDELYDDEEIDDDDYRPRRGRQSYDDDFDEY